MLTVCEKQSNVFRLNVWVRGLCDQRISTWSSSVSIEFLCIIYWLEKFYSVFNLFSCYCIIDRMCWNNFANQIVWYRFTQNWQCVPMYQNAWSRKIEYLWWKGYMPWEPARFNLCILWIYWLKCDICKGMLDPMAYFSERGKNEKYVDLKSLGCQWMCSKMWSGKFEFSVLCPCDIFICYSLKGLLAIELVLEWYWLIVILIVNLSHDQIVAI